MKFGVLIPAICFAFSLPACAKTELDCADFDIRGIYLGASNKILSKLKNAKNLNVNAVVIDIKNDFGEITCDLGEPEISYTPYIRDIKKLLKELKKQGIYTIARIVTFRCETGSIGDFVVKNKDGSTYVDEEKMSWLNPYDKRIWEYIAKVVVATAKVGFDEIQFDYVRLPQYKSLERTTIASELKTKSKTQIVNEFLDFVISKLNGLHVKVSADVFGCAIPEALGAKSTWSSKSIGQDYTVIAEKVDYICPMIYPSHWVKNSFGVKCPDLEPRKIVFRSMEYSKKALSEKSQKARPWIQAFTASWLKKGCWQKYTMKQLQEQVDALRGLGIKQFCFWNPSARYNF